MVFISSQDLAAMDDLLDEDELERELTALVGGGKTILLCLLACATLMTACYQISQQQFLIQYLETQIQRKRYYYTIIIKIAE